MIKAKNLTREFIIKKGEDNNKSNKKETAANFTAVDDVSFSIKEGDFVGYIGPNGAGKSTTIKIMCGILHPTSGELTVMNKRPYENRRENAKNIGVLFGQKSQLWMDLPIIDTLNLHKELYDISANDYKKRLDNLIEMLEMKGFINKPVRKLSLGQRMCGELAAAVLHNPPILILDEPTIGMDVIVKENIRKFLSQINKEQGTTIILTTHDLSDIDKLCERTIIINHGKILFDGKTESLHNESEIDSIVRVKLHKIPDENYLLNFRELNIINKNEFTFLINRNSDEQKLIGDLFNKHSILDIFIEDPQLEHIITRYFKESD